ncbi:MAG: tyrosine--tRNA ligase [Syntrophobacterales bacterium]|nr:tyrosine--tRNA ligase [Syntrophobacterales bacterium]
MELKEGKGLDVLNELKERGFVEQVTDEEGLGEYLSSPSTCYIGFDPTADSLHVGSLVPILSLVHMQRYGHRPIVIVGGGTGLIGDPSGRTEMRKLLSRDDIDRNALGIKNQLARFLNFDDGKALFLNNADWLTPLNYIDFLRDIGCHFSVNRMLATESYRMRLEQGLTFIEFNYMLLQAYDFYYLAKEYSCFLQMGGSDQWGNIVAGVDLIRRKLGKRAYGMTFPLITTASGSKMGKTAQGAVWLSEEKTSVFDFYQYWVNTDDRDVVRFLKLFTFLPLEEIHKVENLTGEQLNPLKRILAYEVTALVHGHERAKEAYLSACKTFGFIEIGADILPSSSIPRAILDEVSDAIPVTMINKEKIDEGVSIVDLFVETGLCNSRSAAKRLIEQGGAYVNDRRVVDIHEKLKKDLFVGGSLLLKAGKKRIHRVRLE